MSRSKTLMSLVLFVAIAALVAIFALAGCSPRQSSTSASTSNKATTMSTEAGEFVSDEQCMSCHGGSYEAVAEATAGLGDWNPHDSIHGGYNSCVNCHAKDKEITYNYCSQCHAYTPDEEALY